MDRATVPSWHRDILRLPQCASTAYATTSMSTTIHIDAIRFTTTHIDNILWQSRWLSTISTLLFDATLYCSDMHCSLRRRVRRHWLIMWQLRTTRLLQWQQSYAHSTISSLWFNRSPSIFVCFALFLFVSALITSVYLLNTMEYQPMLRAAHLHQCQRRMLDFVIWDHFGYISLCSFDIIVAYSLYASLSSLVSELLSQMCSVGFLWW